MNVDEGTETKLASMDQSDDAESKATTATTTPSASSSLPDNDEKRSDIKATDEKDTIMTTGDDTNTATAAAAAAAGDDGDDEDDEGKDLSDSDQRDDAHADDEQRRRHYREEAATKLAHLAGLTPEMRTVWATVDTFTTQRQHIRSSTLIETKRRIREALQSPRLRSIDIVKLRSLVQNLADVIIFRRPQTPPFSTSFRF
jgi:hypothetical protein